MTAESKFKTQSAKEELLHLKKMLEARLKELSSAAEEGVKNGHKFEDNIKDFLAKNHSSALSVIDEVAQKTGKIDEYLKAQIIAMHKAIADINTISKRAGVEKRAVRKEEYQEILARMVALSTELATIKSKPIRSTFNASLKKLAQKDNAINEGNTRFLFADYTQSIAEARKLCQEGGSEGALAELAVLEKYINETKAKLVPLCDQLKKTKDGSEKGRISQQIIQLIPQEAIDTVRPRAQTEGAAIQVESKRTVPPPLPLSINGSTVGVIQNLSGSNIPPVQTKKPNPRSLSSPPLLSTRQASQTTLRTLPSSAIGPRPTPQSFPSFHRPAPPPKPSAIDTAPPPADPPTPEQIRELLS